MIESQYGILLDKIGGTRDYEAVKLAHDQFLSALLAQSFVHMRSVSSFLLYIVFIVFEVKPKIYLEAVGLGI